MADTSRAHVVVIHRPTWQRDGLWAVPVIAVVWLALIPHVIPSTDYDRSIFVSVAERLISGDRLYAGVWDNKDPLFYLSLATARWVTPFGDVALELAWIAAASVAVFVIARWVVERPGLQIILAFAVTPIIVTGAGYLPGHTELPGVALCLATAAGLTARRPILVGLVLASLALVKLIYLPIALVLVIGCLVITRPRGLGPRIAAAFAVTLSGFAVLLLLRGELAPYLDSLVQNLRYAQSPLVDSPWGPVVAHLDRSIGTSSIIALVGIALTLMVRLWPRRHAASDERQRLLWWWVLGTAAGALAVLAATGMWPHHSASLSVSASLAAVLVGTYLRPSRGVASAGAALLLVLVGYLLAGAGDLRTIGTEALTMRASLNSLRDASSEAELLNRLSPPTNYARVGRNDGGAHALGLREWQLACARFHQYPFDSPETLRRALACLSSANVILVTKYAAAEDGQLEWNAFIWDVNLLLAREFTCTDSDVGRVCLRRG